MSPSLVRACGPVVVAVAWLAMVVWTWGSWADPLVDFGRELYVPWRILEGDRLYVDLAYFNGPLSPHVNALWFLVGGTSLRTLFIANLALVALVAGMLWHLLRPVTSALATTIGCVAFVLLFAFEQLLWVSVFNWVAPYSHEVTHGIALGLASLLCFARHLRHGGTLVLAGSGLCAGLGFLTKPETFLATAGALAVACALAPGGEGSGTRLRRPLTLACTGLAVVGLAFLLLLLRLPAGDAFAGVLGGWRHVWNPALGAMPFYRDLLGIHDPATTLRHFGQWCVALAAVLLPAAVVVWIARPRRLGVVLGLAALVVAIDLGLALVARVQWWRIGQILPLAMLGLALAEARRAWRRHRDPGAARSVMRAALATFALLLLLKMLFNARFEHYGFALAMPAAVLGTALLLDWLPRVLARRGGNPLPFQAAGAVVLVATTVGVLHGTKTHLDAKTTVVGSGADELRADHRGRCVQEIVTAIETQRAPGQTLAVLPEGCTLNFWLRMPNPTRFINLMPPEVAMFGAPTIAAAYRADPPDFLVLAHKDTAEYGPRFFGADYLAEMRTWINANYSFVLGTGDQPFVEAQQFGMVLLRRR